MKRRKYSLLLSSVALLTTLAMHEMTDKETEVEASNYGAIANTLEPDWEGVDKKYITGVPKRFFLTKANPHYTYYRQMTGNNRRPRIYYETYAGIIDYYTPVAVGPNKRFSNIHKPEQLWKNNAQKNRSSLGQWTKKPIDTRKQLIDRNKTHHVKKVMDNTNLGRTGYFKYGVQDSNNKINYGMFAGKNGEWRYMGYSESNGDVGNPLFPNDIHQSADFKGKGRNVANTPFVIDPWLPKNRIAHNFVGGGTKFDYAKKGTKEWQIKYNAVKKLIDERPNYRAVSSNPEYWMRRYSLQNDPSGGRVGIFIAATQYNTYHRMFTAPSPSAIRNLTVTKQRVVDSNGTEIRSFSRKPEESSGSTSKQRRTLVAGEKITVETTVRNTTKTSNSNGATTEYAPTLDVGYKTGSGASRGLSFFQANVMDKTYRLTGSSKVGLNKDTVIKQQITVPFSSNTMAVYSALNELTYYQRDNTILTDDFAQMALSVNNESGNAVNKSVKLVDNETGKEVDKPVPGKAYKLRFYFDYSADRNATKNVTVNVNYTINRQLPKKQKDSFSGVVSMKSFKPQKGKRYSVTTPSAVIYETGTFDVSSTLSVDKTSSNYNRDTKDDKASSSFRYDYDITMRNATLMPKVTSHTSNGNMTYLLKFDVDYKVPGHVSNHEKDVQFTVNVGGTRKTFTKHIRQGHNPNVTVEVAVPSNGANKQVTATILANADSNVYEKNYSNNSTSTKANVSNVSKVKPYTGSVRKSNAWNQHYQVHKWSSSNKSYKLFNRNTQFSFPFYKPNGSPKNESVGLSEDFAIKNVWFRSKTTQDLKEGPKKDGWVDLLKEPGKIKAGYGYELKVDVEYKTDAFDKMPKETAAQWVRPSLAKANMANNIYIQTPDNKIHSVDGDGGTEKAMKYSRKDASNGSKTEWTFEIAPRKVLGVNTLGKFYIGEDVANGTYNMTVFTPQTTGVLGKMSDQSTPIDTLLYDQKSNLKIQVVGSATDDVNDHITQ